MEKDNSKTEKYEVYGKDNLRNYDIAKLLGYTVEKNGSVKRGKKAVRPAVGRNGYLQFVAGARAEDIPMLKDLGIHDKKSWTVQIHKYAAWLKYGEAALQKGTLVRHLNGDDHNNSLANLALGTYSDNYYDIPEHVRKARHAAVGKKLRKLSDAEVVELKRDRLSGLTQAKLAEKYGVSLRMVKYLLSGATYNENGRTMAAVSSAS